MGRGLSSQQNRIMQTVRSSPDWVRTDDLLKLFYSSGKEAAWAFLSNPCEANIRAFDSITKKKKSVEASVSRAVRGLERRGLLERVQTKSFGPLMYGVRLAPENSCPEPSEVSQ